MQLAVPFLAAAAGKPLQIGVMRSDELSAGITVFDEDGVARGLSRRAGAAAIGMTLAVRMVYLAPILYLPWVQAALLRRSAALRARPVLQALCYTGITSLSSALVTPVCMALFDQWASLPSSVLEPELRELKRQNGTGSDVRRLYFNKGL